MVALITTPKFVPSSFAVYYSVEPFSCQHCVPAYLSFPRVSFCKVADYFFFPSDLPGFRLTSYRGVGGGCEAQYLRSISQNFLDGFCTLLISMHLHILPFRVGLCHGIHGIPVSPLLLRWRVSDETRIEQIIIAPPGSQNSLSPEPA